MPGLVFLLIASTVLVIAACDRGGPRGGVSWFDLPKPANRAARRH